MNDIGEKIFNLRTEKNVSQEELANALGVTRQTVSRWETDTVIPTFENAKSLSTYFNVDITYFVDSQDIAATNAEHTEQIAVTEKEAVAPPSTIRTDIKIILIVVGIVLLVLTVIACSIMAYINIAPDEGQYVMTSASVNYTGIIFWVVSIVVAAILITITALLIKNYLKNKKNK